MDVRALAFGPFHLDLLRGSLCRGADVVALTPKAMAVLEHLAVRPGHLVTKQELLDAVWPGVFVGDGALKVCVREIRKALGDDPKAPAYIETAHRRGYRFIARVTRVPAADPAPAAAAPRVQYARSGDVSIACQVVGNGPVDLVFVMGWVSHLEYFWKEPSFARFLQGLAAYSRLILFDKRGTGLSDPVPGPATLEQRMDDVRAVMEAVGSDHAVLLGVSEGGPMCTLFAATYPERTDALIMIGSYARRLRDVDYPWGPTLEEREQFCRQIVDAWGGPVGLEERAPSRAADPAFRRWWSEYLRMGASPGAAVALTRMNAEIDIRRVLPAIRVPTLVLHRRNDRCLLVEEGRFLARQIPGARYVELEGEDHLPFVGDQQAILDEIQAFLAGLSRTSGDDSVLATILAGALAGAGGDPARAAGFAAYARRMSQRFRGRLGPVGDDRLMMAFDGPGRAIRCASDLAASAPRFGLSLGIGLHTGECLAGGASFAGPAVDIGRRIADRARPGEVLVSRTVTDLVAGSGLVFEDRGVAALGELGEWRLFAAGPPGIA